MSQNPSTQRTTKVFFGNLIDRILQANADWLERFNLDSEFGGICSPIEHDLSASDLATLLELSEKLRSFQALALFTFLVAEPGPGTGKRDEVASNILSLIPVTAPPLPNPLTEQEIAEYLGIGDSIRCFEVVALYNYTLPYTNKAELVEDIFDSIDDFYEDAIGLDQNGEVINCDPVCSSPPRCRLCDISVTTEE